MKSFNMDTIETTLPNGMKVILIHKPEFEQSFFALGTKAGGLDRMQKREGNPVLFSGGCAHFLEHQMFYLHGQDVTDQFASMSATVNAFTSLYETVYYFSTCADPVKPLLLLMDFVQELDIDEVSVKKEKGIIQSEYEMCQQNPEIRLMQLVWKALYVHHPITVDVLGTPEDIQQMQVQQLQDFYALNYDPSNLVLVGVTGRSIPQFLSVIQQAQSLHPSLLKKTVERFIPSEPAAVAYPILEDTMDIAMPYVALAVKLEPVLDPLEAALLDMALEMTLDAWFSPLNPEYQKWMDQRILTSSAGAECEITTDHAYLLFYAQTDKTEDFFQIVTKTLQVIQEKPVESRIFNSIKNRMYAQNIRTLNHLESLAIEVLQAQIQKISFMEPLRQLAYLNSDSVFQKVSSLNLTLQSRIFLKNETISDSSERAEKESV